jgi:hypothetical protein
MEREQYYINNLNSKYNICKIANSRLGTKQSIKTKTQISIKIRGKIKVILKKKPKKK